MVVMWQAGLVLVGLTGLPHPDQMCSVGHSLMSALNINLDEYTGGYSYTGGNENTGGHLTYTGADGSHQVHQLTPDQMLYAAMATMLVLVLLILVPQAIFACMYKSNVHDKKKAIPEGDRTMQSGKFHHELLKCHENANECLCSCFCPMVRYADTYGSIHGSNFYMSMCTFFAINTVIQCLCIGLVGLVMPLPQTGYTIAYQQNKDSTTNLLQGILRGVWFGVVGRAALRAKLGDPDPGKGSKKLHDFLSYGVFFCCALTQDSVEVDIALDCTVGCPCSVTPGRSGGARAREVAPSDYEALLLEGGR